jgi:hypothetical protein
VISKNPLSLPTAIPAARILSTCSSTPHVVCDGGGAVVSLTGGASDDGQGDFPEGCGEGAAAFACESPYLVN